MSRENDKNYISVGGWMLLLFLTAVPCLGLLLVIVLAFVGENESRKNYFRALIVWFVILALVVGVFSLVVGTSWPQIQKEIQRRIQKG